MYFRILAIKCQPDLAEARDTVSKQLVTIGELEKQVENAKITRAQQVNLIQKLTARADQLDRFSPLLLRLS
tara:strand:+ start:362 stop:574 length:213 start_codon:yes stop_codon:yes gene_type:complete